MGTPTKVFWRRKRERQILNILGGWRSPCWHAAQGEQQEEWGEILDFCCHSSLKKWGGGAAALGFYVPVGFAERGGINRLSLAPPPTPNAEHKPPLRDGCAWDWSFLGRVENFPGAPSHCKRASAQEITKGSSNGRWNWEGFIPSPQACCPSNRV